MRLTPVMLALLLALSPGAVAIQASAPAAPVPSQTDADTAQSSQADTIQPSERNTTTVMMLGTDPARTELDSPSLALGSSLAMERDSSRTRLGVNSLDAQLAAADSVEQKKRIMNRYRYHIENRIISLKAKERRVTGAFSNGTISKREYLRTLGHIDAEAAEIREAITALDEQAESTKFGIDANAMKVKLVTVEGPIRDRIAKTLRGEVAPTRIFVGTADTGIVLSAVIDGTYVRETFRSDNRDPSKQRSITVQNAMKEVIRPRYPWVSDTNHWSGSTRRVYRPIQSIKYTYDYAHGNLTAYVDTGTAKVYREIQYKRLTGDESLPPGPAVSNSTNMTFSEDYTLTVNRTYPGGPLRVKLTNATGASVRGDVLIDGDPVGQTGEDGVLWTLAPAGTFRVTAVHEGTTVNVTTTAMNASSKE